MSGEASVVIEGGTFWESSSEYGGVGWAESTGTNAEVFIYGGDYIGNTGDNGGVFAIMENVDFQVRS